MFFKRHFKVENNLNILISVLHNV